VKQLTLNEQLGFIDNEDTHDVKKFNEEHELTETIDTVNTLVQSSKRYTVLSLFAGCGGLDLGFQGGFSSFGHEYSKNNFDIIWANEIEKNAVKTYQNYFGDHIVCEDVNNIDNDSLPYADVVIGGFPCQDFSIAGKLQGFTVKRGKLYLQMKRVIDAIKPKVFIAENVKNLLVMEKGIVLKTIIEDFKSSGYELYFHLFHSGDYGVPQNRERVFIYGVREDINIVPYLPQATNSSESWMTAKEAIDDLWGKVDDPSIYNHTSKDISRAKFYGDGRKTQGNRRILANKVSPTIRAEHHGNIEGHYRTFGIETDVLNWRRLSVRECARIQSFPDSFNFPTSASSAYKQIGNAVPPILGWHVARALYLSLIKETK